MEITYHYILNTKNWVTLTCLLIMVILVLVSLKNKERFTIFLTLFFSKKYFNIYRKYTKLNYNFFTIALFISQILTFSLLLFLLNKEINAINSYSLTSFISILSLVFFFIVVRYILGKLLGIVFDIEDLQNTITYLKINYLNFIGVLTFPLLLIGLYSRLINSYFIYITASIAIVLLLLFYIYMVIFTRKVIFKNIFYFILYLCTLEITPLVIIIKLITKLK